VKGGKTLPGFPVSLGLTVTGVSLVVLLPLSTLVWAATRMSGEAFLTTVTAPRVVASLTLSLGTAAAAATVASAAGLLIAWVLVRHPFPGGSLVDSLLDLPFALPTAVAGITLTTLYAPSGWLGAPLAVLGVKAAYTPLGIVIALVFLGLPFSVRTLQPILAALDPEVEDAAASLGATRVQTFLRVLFPQLLPAWLTGFALAFARGLGEYGSVVFISGNMPMRTEVAPLLIMTKLEQYDTPGAAAIATVLLGASFLLLFGINRLEAWSAIPHGKTR
jgi:sulfate transport system permease protein